MPDPLLYEINTRWWLNELSDRHSRPVTLADVPDSEFVRWQQLGFTHLWLMGVWTTGPRSRAAALASADLQRACGEVRSQDWETVIAGSPYAIAEYRVPPALGGESGLQEFRRRLHERGMRLLLDFVPNHVGLDHPWLNERPELFVQSPAPVPGTFAQETGTGVHWLAHGRDPNFLPWTDTAQLDYRNPATRSALERTLLGIAGRCDGMRCDMAMLVLSDVFAKIWAGFPPPGFAEPAAAGGPAAEFWQEAIASTKQAHPDFIFLAEAYWGLEARLQSFGFDYTYDKRLYDALIGRNPVSVQQHLVEATPQFIEASAHFLENHDEPPIASILSPAAHRAAALVILSLPGMRLLHDGQLEGACVKTPIQLSRRCAGPRRVEAQQMYEQMLGALRKTAIGRGSGRILRPREAWAGNPTAPNIILVRWQAGPPEFDLAAVNLAPQRSQCYAPLGVENLAGHNWLMQDLLGTEEYRRDGAGLQRHGLFLDLPGHGAQLFHFKPIA
jgi:hypothetical protein